MVLQSGFRWRISKITSILLCASASNRWLDRGAFKNVGEKFVSCQPDMIAMVIMYLLLGLGHVNT